MKGLENPSIAIVDVDSGVPIDEIQKVAAALQRQVREHFAPAWGIGDLAIVHGVLSVAPRNVGPDEWRLELRKVPTIDGALGYHDETADGMPLLYVFPELCAQDGTTWSSCASHEILEALADPYLRRLVQLNDGRIAALEACDQVEALSYEIDGVQVSNFNTPANFEPPKNLAGVTFDYLGKQTAPFQVLDGGYAQVLDPTRGWVQLGTSRSYRRRVAELGLSRGVRRASPVIAA